MSDLRVFGGHDGGSGCAYFRMEVPLKEMAKHDGFDVEFAAAGDYAGTDIPVITAETLKGYDVIVAQRWNKHSGLGVWRRARGPFNRLVYDIDDDVFNVTAENWAAFKLYNRPDIRDATAHAAETADLVTVSAEPLAEVMRQFNDHVIVLPNHVPGWVLDLPRVYQRRPRIGWQGGASHGLDIGVVAEPVRQFLEKFPKWDLQLNGTDYRPTFAADPARMFYEKWIQVNTDPENYYRTIDFDIGLAPLVPTAFSSSKSFLKALEYGARGIPVIATDCEPYHDYVQDGVNGFLIQREEQWLDRLGELASDSGLRARMGVQARERARAYTIEQGWTMWRDAYQSLFKNTV
jgi:glycosyltransferase involved in cell wall biosynthesis